MPLRQVWPDDLVARYREAGHWRGETFPAFLRRRAECYADDIAVVAGDVRLSYAQLWHEAGRIGAGLLARGLQPGERVLVQLGNTAGFITTVCGLFRAGLVPVPKPVPTSPPICTTASIIAGWRGHCRPTGRRYARW
ncbi:hypothetical protein G6F22_010276 [Rhizopus arrhizus]|nr:hypothetical protein G6F22_010276 [Rhizopus arrhizus]